MKLKWLAAIGPLLLGLALDLVLFFTARPVPIAFLRADLGSLALLLGLAATITVLILLILRERSLRTQQAEQAILRAQFNDERRRFLQRLDHELKNPLTAIRAGLVNVRDTSADSASGDALESVEAQALRLSRLAADLRKLAELETRPIERTEVDLDATLKEIYNLALDRDGADHRQITLTLPQAPWPLPKIQGDQDLLFLAVHNLLENAIKFTRPGDTIEVRAFEDGQSVVIEIADTGQGIPEEDLPHVWEELYRGSGARGIPGSGLGLALVRAITERHNGQVSLRSKAGKGTVFGLHLPMNS